MNKFEIQQTLIKDVEDEQELEIIYSNFRKYGWSDEQVDNLKRTGFMQREGKVQGQFLSEVVRVNPKFKVIENVKR